MDGKIVRIAVIESIAQSYDSDLVAALDQLAADRWHVAGGTANIRRKYAGNDEHIHRIKEVQDVQTVQPLRYVQPIASRSPFKLFELLERFERLERPGFLPFKDSNTASLSCTSFPA